MVDLLLLVVLLLLQLVGFKGVVNSREYGTQIASAPQLHGNAVVFHPNGRGANHSGNHGLHSRVGVYDMMSGQQLGQLTGHYDSVTCCVYRSSAQVGGCCLWLA